MLVSLVAMVGVPATPMIGIPATAMVGVPTNHAYNSYTPTGLTGVGIFLVAGGDTSHGLKWRSLCWLSVVENMRRRVVPSGVEGQAQHTLAAVFYPFFRL